MSIPASAPVPEEGIDPADIVDFVIDLSPLLEVGESFDEIDFAVAAEGVLLGFTILDAGPHLPVEIEDALVRIWVTVDPAFHGHVAWRGDGTLCAVEFTATTTAARTFQRSIAIRVIEK